MDLSQYSVAELKSLLAAIPAEIKRREKSEKARIRKELEALAAKAGYSLEELLSAAETDVKKARSAVAPKYQHPQNADLQWTGRGRQPRWVVEFLANGGSLEQLSI